MSSQADREALLRSTLKTMRARYPHAVEPQPLVAPVLDPAENLLTEFVYSFLLWESTAVKAAAALKRLESSVVDFNELRICMADELARSLGDRYPRVEERCLRLRASLNDVFSRQHTVSLEHLASSGKREAKDYLESLDGVPRFVSSRVLLLRLGLHAAPVDSRIARRLAECGLIGADLSPEEAASMLERKTKSGELLEAYQLLQAWSDDSAADPAPDAKDHRPAKPAPKDGKRAPAPGPGAARTRAPAGKHAHPGRSTPAAKKRGE